jgi:hypothetical protein
MNTHYRLPKLSLYLKSYWQHYFEIDYHMMNRHFYHLNYNLVKLKIAKMEKNTIFIPE